MTDKRPKPGETLGFDFSAPAPAPAPVVPAKPEIEVFTVGQVGRMLGRALEQRFGASLWVEGEVTGARPAASGHLYFCLKDEAEDASIDVVVYRTNVTARARTLMKDGARVRVRGKPQFWAPRGRLSFVGDRIDATGKGALLEALDRLKEKLRAEGLFAPERKRPIPQEARLVGVVTSVTGAVIHDICKVAFRRGGSRILLSPASVQGNGAADAIQRALAMLQRVPGVDVIIVARGGGGSDDLMAFNDEAVVRAIAACRVPVVSAVGHEVDVTLVDFVADARAATPSQAAEMVVPDANARLRLLDERTHRLARAMHHRLAVERRSLERMAHAFRDPRATTASARERLARLSSRLAAAHPQKRIAKDRAVVTALASRLAQITRKQVAGDRRSLADLGGRLDAMSPLKVLARGYAIATRADGRAVRDAAEVSPGDRVHVRVASGDFDAEVVKR